MNTFGNYRKTAAAIIFVLLAFSLEGSGMSCRDALEKPSIEGFSAALPSKTVAGLVATLNGYLEGLESRYSAYKKKLKAGTTGTDDHRKQTVARIMKRFNEKENPRAYENAVLTALLSRTGNERLHYLQSLSRADFLNLDDEIKYTLFGLPIQKMDSELRAEFATGVPDRYGDELVYFHDEGSVVHYQSMWRDLYDAIDAMELKAGETVVDLGSGTGNLGLLIGLLRPDVKFIGLEIVGLRTSYANKASEELGFKNVRYVTTNLADLSSRLPQADHFYAYSPLNEATSEIVTEKLLTLSNTKSFKVYFLGGLSCTSFYSHFHRTSIHNVIQIYEKNSP
jgi:hypothetical protein